MNYLNFINAFSCVMVCLNGISIVLGDVVSWGNSVFFVYLFWLSGEDLFFLISYC